MDDETVKIEVFAVLCAKCRRMELVVNTAVEELGDEVKTEVIKNTDIFELKGRGVVANPTLIIDDKIVASGVVPSLENTKEMIREAYHRRKEACRKDKDQC